MSMQKLDKNKIKWLCPDFYISLHYADSEIPDLYVCRDSVGFAARVPLDHTEQFSLTANKINSDILRAVIETINNKLLFDDEEVVINEDEMYITTTK